MLKPGNLKLWNSARHGLIFYLALYFPHIHVNCKMKRHFEGREEKKEGAVTTKQKTREKALVLFVSGLRGWSAFY